MTECLRHTALFSGHNRKNKDVSHETLKATIKQRKELNKMENSEKLLTAIYGDDISEKIEEQKRWVYQQNMNTKIKDWYLEEYPQSEKGKLLKDNITFDDLYEWLDKPGNITEFLGTDYWLVRGNVFEQLAYILGCDFQEIEQQWLG